MPGLTFVPRPRPIPARPDHALEQLPDPDLDGAELHGPPAVVRGHVVVVALEAMAGDAHPGGERVQLVEALVADEMAPVPERQPRMGVIAELVDEDQSGPLLQGPVIATVMPFPAWVAGVPVESP